MKGHIKEYVEAFHIFDGEISKGANTPEKVNCSRLMHIQYY